jgi:tetratricopeptide (TPR) repeat protein/DNA-binding CsgD family transcriptional regulator
MAGTMHGAPGMTSRSVKTGFDLSMHAVETTMETSMTGGDVAEVIAEEIDRPLAELLPLLDRYSRDDPRRAVAIAERALEHPTAEDDPTARAKTEQLLGAAHRTIGNYELALAHYHNALERFEEIGATSDGIAVLNGIGLIYVAVEEYREALVWFQRIVDAGPLVKNPLTLANARLNIGVAHCNTGDYRRALESFDMATTRFQRNGGRRGEALATLGIGTVHTYLGEYAAALDCFRTALAITEEIGERQGIALALTNVANIYHLLDRNEEALEHFQRLAGIFEEMGTKRFRADLLTNMGITLERLHRVDEALAVLAEALALYDEIGLPVGRARPLRTIAVIHTERGAHEPALASLREAIAAFEACGDRHSLVGALHESAEPLMRLGRHDEALQQLERSLRLAEEIGARPVVASNRRSLAELYEMLGDPAAALRQYRAYQTVQEELLRQDAAKKIENARLVAEITKARSETAMYRLRTEQMEREIELQNRHVTTLAMNLVHQNEFLQSLHDELMRIAGSQSPEIRLSIRKAARNVKQQAQAGEGWSAFEEGFSRLQGDFMARLAEHCPALSPTEIRVCALLKISLASKDIAKLLCVTGRCVETHRYNIRRKLGLRREENLITYLLNSF